MFKKVLGILVVSSLFVCSAGFCDQPGGLEKPMVYSIGQQPTLQPAPVFSSQSAPAVVATPGIVRQPMPMAPYEVSVQYTPIQPQAGECTYCTCLPYGCPDGSPIVTSICGSDCGGCVSCGNSCSVGLFSNVLGTVGGVADGLVGASWCAASKVTCGVFQTVSNIGSCLLCSNNQNTSYIQ